jgi:hypothetical protein
MEIYGWSTIWNFFDLTRPQQPPSERVPIISEKLHFWWSIQQKRTSIGYFGASDDQTIRIRRFFEEIGLKRLLRPVRLQGLLRSMRLERFLRPKKLPFFPKYQYKVEFKNLDDYEVLSSDFPGLRTSAVSMTSTASTTSITSMTFTASFHQKITDPDGLIILGTRMTNIGPF